MDEEILERPLSRRQFIKLSLTTTAALASEACLPKRPERAERKKPRSKVEETKEPEKAEITEVKIHLGKEEKLSPPELQWVPDGHTSMLKDFNGRIKLWVAAGPRSFLLEGDSLETLGSPQLVLGPERTKSEKGYDGYASFGSIIPGERSNELIGFFHQEHWPSEMTSFPFTASIRIAKSIDDGRNWEKGEAIIEGGNPVPFPGERVSGAGQPSAIIKEDEVYLYYIDWDVTPHSIHLVKAQLDLVHKPKAWEKHGEPVILPPTNREGTLYAALPSISYNTYLNKYLAVFETNIGFYLALSKDAVEWNSFQLFFEFPQPHSHREPGDIWFSYPTLLSPKANSDRETGKTGWLYYSRGIWERQSHYMVRRPFQLE